MSITKICEICGKQFEARNVKVRVCSDVHTRTCCVCGKQFVLKHPYTQMTCSSKCRGIYRKESGIAKASSVKARNTLKTKYGVSNLKDLRKSVLKRCKYCGKEFETTSPQQEYCSDIHYGSCPICGKRVEIKDMTVGPPCCSKKCKSIKTILTNREKYGVDNVFQSDEIKEKSKQTNLDKYGVEHYSQTDEYREKFKQTCLDRFGTCSPLENADIKEKQRQTNIERYGGGSPTCDPFVKQKMIDTLNDKYGGVGLQSSILRSKIHSTNLNIYGVEIASKNEDVKKKTAANNIARYGVKSTAMLDEVKYKAKQTNLEKYGYDHPMKNSEFCKNVLAKSNATIYDRYGVDNVFRLKSVQEKAKSTNLSKYGVPWFVYREECSSKNYSMISKINRSFGTLLKANNIQFSYEFRLENKSFDFKIKDSNILIEIDPSITHNSAVDVFGGDPKSMDYHKNKTDIATKYGYRCIHVWDWDDWNSIIDLLSISNTIYGRACNISTIDLRTANIFTNKNHISGTCKGQQINYGLYHDGELVMVMTFGKPRYTRKYDYELLRLCSKKGTRVVGGASKLFHRFLSDYPNRSVISYCDASKFTGSVYENIGMTYKYTSDPALIWSKDDKYITSNLLRQRGFDQLFGTNYGKGTSNEELMLEHKWLPVYDCGQKVYVYHHG